MITWIFTNRGTHGTDDVTGFGDRYQPAARALKKYWDDGKAGSGTLTPVENAENIAAAATGEWLSSMVSSKSSTGANRCRVALRAEMRLQGDRDLGSVERDLTMIIHASRTEEDVGLTQTSGGGIVLQSC